MEIRDLREELQPPNHFVLMLWCRVFYQVNFVLGYYGLVLLVPSLLQYILVLVFAMSQSGYAPSGLRFLLTTIRNCVLIRAQNTLDRAFHFSQDTFTQLKDQNTLPECGKYGHNVFVFQISNSLDEP